MTGLVPFYRRDLLTGLSEANDLFDQFFNSSWVPVVNRGLRCDVMEQDNRYLIEVDLPGVKKEDIEIHLEEGLLTIAVKEQEGKEDDKNNQSSYIIKERKYAGCQRSFKLSDRVTKADVKAKFEDGVLTLTIDKKEDEAKDTKINIV